MITATKNWFARNRTRLAVGAGVLGAGYMAAQYALTKINEARQRLSDDRIARENLRRRFAQNQEDCTYTVLALLPTAAENILEALRVEDITAELQARKSDKMARSTASSELAPSEVASTADGTGGGDAASNTGSGSGTGSGFVHASQTFGTDAEPQRTKAQLWDDLKICSVTRAFTLIYTLALLTLLTRIQLNLLGRRNYLSSVVSLASPPQEGARISLENHDDDNPIQDYGSDFDTNRKYLTFSWWLLHRGWSEVKSRVEEAAADVFGPVTARDNVTFGRFSELTLAVRRRVEGSTEGERRSQQWLKFLLPPIADEEMVLRESGVLSDESPIDDAPAVPSSLRRLLDETSDLIESPTFTHVLTLELDAAFSLLVDDKLATLAFKISPQAKAERSPLDGSSFLDANPLLASSERVTELAEDGTTPADRANSCKVATILAVLTRQAHAIGSGAMMEGNMSELSGMGGPSIKDSNEYLAAIESVHDLEAFAAVVYSSNFEFESIELETAPEAAETEGQQAVPSSKNDIEDSVVEVDTDVDRRFESAWGKAQTNVVTGEQA